MTETRKVVYEVSQRERPSGEKYDVISVEHGGRRIDFETDVKGPENYFLVGEQIDSDDLRPKRATLEQAVALVHSAVRNIDKPHAQEIVRKLTEGFWGFNGVLCVPNEGIYVEDLPEIRGGRVVVNKGNARFASFGYLLGDQSPGEIIENRGVKALVREEGAEKFAEIARAYRVNPFFGGYVTKSEELTLVPILFGDQSGVHIGYNFFGSDDNAFGVGVLE